MTITFTNPPTLPSLSDPANFNDRALGLFSWLTGTFIPELEAVEGLIPDGGDFAVDGNTLYVDVSTDRVGFGTSTPAAELDVDGDLLVRGGEIFFNTSTTSGDYLKYETAKGLTYFENGSEVWRLSSNNLSPSYLAMGGENVGIGTTNPLAQLHSFSTGSPYAAMIESNQTSSSLVFASTGSSNKYYQGINTGDGTDMRIFAGNSTRMTVTAAGDVGIGTTSPSSKLDVSGSGDVRVEIESTSSGDVSLDLMRTGANSYRLVNDAGDFKIQHGSTPAGVATNTRVVVTNVGDVGIGNPNPGTRFVVYESENSTVTAIRNTNATFTQDVFHAQAVRAASSLYNTIRTSSDIDGTPDTEFKVRGDGEVTADGSFNGGGADYAEYFEWSDGNPNGEDRVGYSVVLDGEKIRLAQDGEEPIGVISGNPSVVGDGDIDRWKQKYLRDDFGRYIMEDYDVLAWTEGDEEHTYDADNVPDDVVVPDDAQTVVQQRRKLNPDFDPDMEYISRENRPEWDTVGLMGKLRILKGQPTGSRWLKMRDVSANVEEWLVR